MSYSTDFKFRAFIPKKLGKPLIDYFRGQIRYKYLNNKEEFLKKLTDSEINKHYWLPEPQPFGSFGNFYATDNVDFYHSTENHSFRLGFHLEIFDSDIGEPLFQSDILKHKEHTHGNDYGIIGNQHSSLSHRIKAGIHRISFYQDMPKASNRDVYIGKVGKLYSKRSKEKPLEITINSSKNNTFSLAKAKTRINISAAANYPFLDFISPDIDFSLSLIITKSHDNRSVGCTVQGWHNGFPAYELLINNKRIYKYNPADMGYSGPNVYNLSLIRKEFYASKWFKR